MTDEEAFVLAINGDPRDTTARLVYADWLDDQDLDGSGWRAVAAYRPYLGYKLAGDKWGLPGYHCGALFSLADLPAVGALPEDWFVLIPKADKPPDITGRWWRCAPTIYPVEAAAAEAFLKLAPVRRVALLETFT